MRIGAYRGFGSRSWLRAAAIFAVVVTAMAIAGCSPDKPSFRASDVTGTTYGKELQLTGHDGKPHALADFRGKVVALFFGYVQCPDVCPTTMVTLADVMRQLGPDAARVQVLFVTVDPERDTQSILAEYVPAFNPSFLGLWGDAEATARVAKEFRVFYQKRPGTVPNTYTMDHSAGTYLFDTEGRLRVYVSYGQGADVILHDIRELLRAGP